MEAFLDSNALTALAGPLAPASLDELVALAHADREQLMLRLKGLGVTQLGKRHAVACALLRQASSGGECSGAASSEAASAAARDEWWLANERFAAVPLVTRPPTAPSSGAPADDRTAARGPRCALLLFGLPKFFAERVFPLMVRKLIEQIPMPCDIFAHTYDITQTTNMRNREEGCALDPSEVQAASPLAFELQSQEAVDLEQSAELERLKAHGDAWRNEFVSLRNVLREANSLSRVHALMAAAEERQGFRYALVCCSRMDVFYVDKLPPECVRELRKAHDGSLAPNALFVPSFHEWRLSSDGAICRSGGMNDRFAVGAPTAMRAYAAGRLDAMLPFCEAKRLPLHTETFLQWHMRREGADARRMHFRLQRLRANGEVHDGDRELLPS